MNGKVILHGKILARQIATSYQERARFKIEAQAAAALNHPNIATIHVIEEIDGEMFIVMEFIVARELGSLIHSPLQEARGRFGLMNFAHFIYPQLRYTNGLRLAGRACPGCHLQ